MVHEAISGFVYEWDVQSNRVERSAGTLGIVGLLPLELGLDLQCWHERIHPAEIARCRRMMHDAFDDGEGMYCLDYRVRHVAGSYVYVCERGRIVRDESGRPLRVIGHITESGRRKQLERDVLQLTRELDQVRAAASAANSSKARLLAALSHELRTPLTPVMTLVQMLEADPSLPDNLRDSIGVIGRNVALEVKLIDDLLDLTRVTQKKLLLHFATVDVHAKIRHVEQLCTDEIRAKSLKLNLRLNARCALVQGDAARLQQVLWNLLRNSVKFTPVGGRITISTSTREDGRLTVSVRDSGVGIAPAQLLRLFDAFENLGRTPRPGGLGLALAISRAVVQMHGGTLGASSAGRGRGATFTLSLPLSKERTSDASFNGLTKPAVASKLRVLLVEDHPDTADAMVKVLQRTGYSVRHADTVTGALRAAEAEGFDLLLSDLGLPDGSGHDLIRQLLARGPVRGVAVSGFGMEEDIRRSREAGFAAHLTKPVNLRQLQQTIHDVLQEGSCGACGQLAAEP